MVWTLTVFSWIYMFLCMNFCACTFYELYVSHQLVTASRSYFFFFHDFPLNFTFPFFHSLARSIHQMMFFHHGAHNIWAYICDVSNHWSLVLRATLFRVTPNQVCFQRHYSSLITATWLYAIINPEKSSSFQQQQTKLTSSFSNTFFTWFRGHHCFFSSSLQLLLLSLLLVLFLLLSSQYLISLFW